jgi:hypothetical protein
MGRIGQLLSQFLVLQRGRWAGCASESGRGAGSYSGIIVGMTDTSRPGSAWVAIVSYEIEEGCPRPLGALRA